MIPSLSFFESLVKLLLSSSWLRSTFTIYDGDIRS